MEQQPLTTKVLHGNIAKSLSEFVASKQLKGAILNIHGEGKDALDWSGSVGNLEVNTPYFLAEVSFLQLAALALKLRVRGKWKLSDKATEFLPEGIGEKLLVRRKKDLSSQIEIEHLLAHRSGLGDFFTQKTGKNLSYFDQIQESNDISWTEQDLIQLIWKALPAFSPGTRKKVFFSHSNYYLLGLVISKVSNQRLNNLLRELQYTPLGLTQTYTYDNPLDRTPSCFYYKDTMITVPKFIASLGAVGGLVSTAKDNMAFLRAFFHGHLFPVEYIEEMQRWFPAGNGQFYGIGLSKYKPQGIPALFSNEPPLIGMTGFSGAFALYVPDKNAYFTGTVNQMADPHLAYKLVHRICRTLP